MMKIDDVKVGARVRWRNEGGVVVWVQPTDANDARSVRDEVYGEAAKDFRQRRAEDAEAGRARSSEYSLATPDRMFSVDLRRRRVLVRLDRVAEDPRVKMTSEDHENYEYLWATPRALRAEKAKSEAA